MKILAINPTHDSSVCVLNNGELEFFCKEERVSGLKRDKNPLLSLDLALKKIDGPIDHFIWASPSNNGNGMTDIWIKNQFDDVHYAKLLTKKLNFNSRKSFQFKETGHHNSHAMLAFVNSQFEKALVFVIDHDGTIVYIDNENVARECESVFIFDKEREEIPIHKSYWMMQPFQYKSKVREFLRRTYPNCHINVNNELGIVKVYEAATTLIGQGPLENGKTMGLSSYGEDIEYEQLFIDDIPVNNYFETTYNSQWICFNDMQHFITRDINKNNYQFYANKAKQVQNQTQQVVLNLIRKYVEFTGINNVCLVGGYALNVVANNFYIKNLPNVNFYFEPTADDTGITIGAAMVAHYRETGCFAKPLKNNFYQYYDDSEKINDGVSSSLDEIVTLLQNNKSVAIFEGSPEAGPRALGHRSILFNPTNPNAKEIINDIKRREWYRPFAGVVLLEHFEEYFETLGIKESPYMTINFDAKKHTKELVPGIIHVDGTCRIQTVKDGTLFELLQMFNERTQCPMLLNTSFNLAGEPLVQTKQDAIRVFENSSLDALYFVDDSLLLTK